MSVSLNKLTTLSLKNMAQIWREIFIHTCIYIYISADQIKSKSVQLESYKCTMFDSKLYKLKLSGLPTYLCHLQWIYRIHRIVKQREII